MHQATPDGTSVEFHTRIDKKTKRCGPPHGLLLTYSLPTAEKTRPPPHPDRPIDREVHASNCPIRDVPLRPGSWSALPITSTGSSTSRVRQGHKQAHKTQHKKQDDGRLATRPQEHTPHHYPERVHEHGSMAIHNRTSQKRAAALPTPPLHQPLHTYLAAGTTPASSP